MAIFNKVKGIKETKSVKTITESPAHVKFVTWLLDRVFDDDTEKVCDLLKDVYINNKDDQQHVMDLSVGVHAYLVDHLGADLGYAQYKAIISAVKAARSKEPEEEDVKTEPEKETKKSKK